MENDISVIIPSHYKRFSLLIKCLNSIKRQTYRPSEVLIIINSIPQNFKIKKKLYKKILHKYPFRIKISFQKKKGSIYARNLGFRKSSFNNLFFIDDDCIAEKNWLKEGLNSLRKHSIIMGVSKNYPKSSIFSYIENYQTNLFMKQGIYNKKKFFTLFLDTKNFAIKRNLIFKKRLLFNKNFSYFSIFEDIDFGLKVIKSGEIIRINKKMVVYHTGRNNFFNHVKREFFKGMALCYFLNHSLPFFLKKLSKKKAFLIIKAIYLNRKNMNTLCKKKLEKNSLLKYLLIKFDYFINLLGYYLYLLSFSFIKKNK